MSWRSDNPLWPPSLREATGTVHHYTDAHGLKGMVENGVLWCSEAASLNDLDEVRCGWELVDSWLQRQPDTEAADALRAALNPAAEKGHEVFVLSASTSKDDANQWRLYGGRSAGYCVALDADVPLAVVANYKPHGHVATGLGTPLVDMASVSPWMHVLYDTKEATAALDELLPLVDAELKNIAQAATSTDHYDFLIQDFQADCYEVTAAIAHLIKASGFSGENEVRAVATTMFGERHLKYRAGAYGLTAYAELTERGTDPPDQVVRGSKRVPLLGVHLGPLLRPEHADTIKRLLRVNGYRTASRAVEASGLKLR